MSAYFYSGKWTLRDTLWVKISNNETGLIIWANILGKLECTNETIGLELYIAIMI